MEKWIKTVFFVVLGALLPGQASGGLSGVLNVAYLGFGPPFSPASQFAMGRWPEGVLTLGYNPAGAPPPYRRNADFERVLEATIEEWESVCGVRLNSRGSDVSLVVEDRSDGVVAIVWRPSLGSASGRAGPSTASLRAPAMTASGYYSFADGQLELSAASFNGGIGSASERDWLDRKLMTVLLHEIAHILGIGHSDQPSSIMFAGANIWIPGLRKDDIEACQALYGPPSRARRADRERPVKLQQAKSIQRSGLAVRRHGNYEIISTLGAREASPLYLFVELEGQSAAAVRIVARDASGQVIAEPMQEAIDCDIAHGVCRWWLPVGEPDLFRATPGRATVLAFVDDKPSLQHEIDVEPGWSTNEAPRVKIKAKQSRGRAPLDLDVEVSVEDPEGDSIAIVWHVPGHEPMVVTGVRGPTQLTRTFRIEEAGQHEILVQVWDDAPRYLDAGDGFRILMRQVVNAR